MSGGGGGQNPFQIIFTFSDRTILAPWKTTINLKYIFQTSSSYRAVNAIRHFIKTN